MPRLLAILLVLLAAAPALAQETLKHGDTISGKLRFFLSQHPNGTWIKVYQIASDNPRNFAENDEFCPDYPPKKFHIFVLDDKAKEARLKRLLGKKISLVADKFFCSETAWHIGDAVVTDWHFAVPEKP
jgi:hypothetical protein